jgi:hypothetical protein
MQLFPTATYLMLQRCPALLSSQFLVGAGDIVPANKVFTLHHLTTLKLVAHAVVKWDNLLRLLVTPSLTSLVIIGSQILLEILASLISRYNCSLATVTLHKNDSPLNNHNLGLFIENLATVT